MQTSREPSSKESPEKVDAPESQRAPETSIDMDEAERAYFLNIIRAFQHYPEYAFGANNVRLRTFYALPQYQQDLVAATGFKARLDEINCAIRMLSYQMMN